jgi:5-hydroxyisourate hydrolase
MMAATVCKWNRERNVGTLGETLMGRLTTHVLDTANGRPGAGVRITLYRNLGERYMLIGDAVTNADGRCGVPLLEGDAFTKGRYRLVFAAGEYFANIGTALPDPPFVDEVVLDFGVADAALHYHVPLLVSPWSYSTYRGS